MKIFRAHRFLQLFIKTDEFRLIASTKSRKLRFRQFLQLLKGVSDFTFQFGIFFTSHALLRLASLPAIWAATDTIVCGPSFSATTTSAKTGGFLFFITKMM